MIKPQVMISSCLLGESVRYDGQHKFNNFVDAHFKPFVELVSNCPEVACGMPIPRPPIHIQADDKRQQLVQVTNPKVDYSEAMTALVQQKLTQYPGLCGVISKTKSPSCGVKDTPITNTASGSKSFGRGFFIDKLIKARPFMPVIDEQQLQQEQQRHRFLLKVFTLARWYQAKQSVHDPIKLFLNHHRWLLLCLSFNHPAPIHQFADQIAHPLTAEQESQFLTQLMALLENPIELKSVQSLTSEKPTIAIIDNDQGSLMDSKAIAELLNALAQHPPHAHGLELIRKLNLEAKRLKLGQLLQNPLFEPYPSALIQLKA